MRGRYLLTIFSWSAAILFVHKYTAGSTSSGDKASKLQQKDNYKKVASHFKQINNVNM